MNDPVMQELLALSDLLGMMLSDPRIVVLTSLLLLASISDYRTHRIPNRLTAGGTVFGLIYAAVVPFSTHQGVMWAVGGMVVGFLIMIPFYALKVMGAGDVKLMAMIGAFVGISDVLHAAVYAFLVGGVFALAYALHHKALVRMLGNVKTISQNMVVSAVVGFKPDLSLSAEKSIGKMPFGISISLGTAGYLMAKQLGYV